MAPQGGDRLRQVLSRTGDQAVEQALGGCSGGFLRKSSHGSRAQGSPAPVGGVSVQARPPGRGLPHGNVPGPKPGRSCLARHMVLQPWGQHLVGVRDRLVPTPPARCVRAV